MSGHDSIDTWYYTQHKQLIINFGFEVLSIKLVLTLRFLSAKRYSKHRQSVWIESVWNFPKLAFGLDFIETATTPSIKIVPSILNLRCCPSNSSSHCGSYRQNAIPNISSPSESKVFEILPTSVRHWFHWNYYCIKPQNCAICLEF